MKKTFVSIALFFLVSLAVQSQDIANKQIMLDKLSFGLGGGLDYGGFGGNLLFYPQKNIGLFAGAGYALAGFGYNVGAKIRYIKDENTAKISPYIIGMYGYNAAIAVANATDFNELFYGPSFGIGIDYKLKPESKGYWSFALILPLRSSEVDIYIDDLKNNHGVEFKNELLPVAISVGYRFIIN